MKLSLSPSLPSEFVCLLVLLTCFGCRSERAELPVEFEPNLVHTIKYEIQNEFPMDQASQDAMWVVSTMFGTPDEPSLPSIVAEDKDFAAIVSHENLMRASGPANAEGRGLFRKHCVVCHGVTGNGRGPTAAVQVPYPRDYRMGIFKFKSTPRGVKPTRSDLARLIANGIGGTAMIKIPELADQDIDALVDYVIYLSWRGELERRIIDDAVYELDLEGGDRVLNTELATRLSTDRELAKQLDEVLEGTDGDQLELYEEYLEFQQRLTKNPKLKSQLEAASEEDEALAEDLEAYERFKDLDEEMAADNELGENLAAALKVTTGAELSEYENYAESWEIIQDFAVEIGESWLEAEEEALEVPVPPEDLPVAESSRDVAKFQAGDEAEAFAASVKRGRELFVGKIASCSKCHGETGKGDGQTTDYDDWTKDWTTRVGLKPEDHESLIPLLARGALPPKNAIPRNFAEGVYRGGASSEQIYRRITQGIDGTPMPAATFVEGEFEAEDVWHLVNFIRSLEQPLIDDEENETE